MFFKARNTCFKEKVKVLKKSEGTVMGMEGHAECPPISAPATSVLFRTFLSSTFSFLLCLPFPNQRVEAREGAVEASTVGMGLAHQPAACFVSI